MRGCDVTRLRVSNTPEALNQVSEGREHLPPSVDNPKMIKKKNCLFRKGRCINHRVDLKEEVKKERILDRNELGMLEYKTIEVKKLVCVSKYVKNTPPEASRMGESQGEVGRGGVTPGLDNFGGGRVFGGKQGMCK